MIIEIRVYVERRNISNYEARHYWGCYYWSEWILGLKVMSVVARRRFSCSETFRSRKWRLNIHSEHLWEEILWKLCIHMFRAADTVKPISTIISPWSNIQNYVTPPSNSGTISWWYCTVCLAATKSAWVTNIATSSSLQKLHLKPNQSIVVVISDHQSRQVFVSRYREVTCSIVMLHHCNDHTSTCNTVQYWWWWWCSLFKSPNLKILRVAEKSNILRVAKSIKRFWPSTTHNTQDWVSLLHLCY